jgi:hypothetical protein
MAPVVMANIKMPLSVKSTVPIKSSDGTHRVGEPYNAQTNWQARGSRSDADLDF